ncbi:MAG: serine protease [Symploca sp. SIO1B1]|nr:serine protease [Symploca sp. SIO1A3]NER92891.1 serine protease [Symploca sp. SIO1B1]
MNSKNGQLLALVSCIGGLLLLPASVFDVSMPAAKVFAQHQNQVSDEQLHQIAKSITVRVFSGNDDVGSGTLVGKQQQVYQVLTNAHVVTSDEAYRIQTPDGRIYPANLVENVDFGKTDLALLEFQSNGNYAIASLGRASALALNELVFAAGFPYNSEKLVVNQGQFTQWEDQSLVGGYQMGYNNNIQQGMSGGPVLNPQGEVVAINSLGAYPILNNAYKYENGEQPDPFALEDLRKSNWGITIETFIALVPGFDYSCVNLSQPSVDDSLSPQSLPPVVAKNYQKIREVTVLLDAPGKQDGSGVIIGKEGNTYTVLTAEHVVSQKAQDGRYDVVTSKGEGCPVNYRQVKQLPGSDLAILEFTSNLSYPVATLANYPRGRDRKYVFVSGWSKAKSDNSKNSHLFEYSPGFLFDEESSPFWTRDFGSLTYGYKLVYSNFTTAGMSGGPILDTQGRVIGIHGRLDGVGVREEVGNLRPISLVFSLGVPISTFLNLTAQAGTEVKGLQIETVAPPNLTASEKNSITQSLLENIEIPNNSTDAIAWINYGNQLWRLLQPEAALAAFNQAIQLEPDFSPAWYAHGLVLHSQGKYQEAIESLDKAIQEDSKDFFPLWRLRGWVLYSQQEYQAALESFEKLLALDPQSQTQDFALHLLRGLSLRGLGRYQEATVAYTQAIAINPHPWAYNNRGNAYYDLKNYQKALSDYSNAIELDPNFAAAYETRGQAYCQIGDEQTALRDFQQAAELYRKQEQMNEYQEAVNKECQEL